jgi:hypothetical protein
LILAFFGSDCAYFYIRGLPLPDLFLKVRKRTECFKLKLNAYLAFKITFDKERLPLLPIKLTKFLTPLLAKTPTCKTGF